MHFRMDWRSVNFDWNRARAFLVTAEEGSLSAAARALGMAQPTLGRQVDALQDAPDVSLFAGGRAVTGGGGAGSGRGAAGVGPAGGRARGGARRRALRAGGARPHTHAERA